MPGHERRGQLLGGQVPQAVVHVRAPAEGLAEVVQDRAALLRNREDLLEQVLDRRAPRRRRSPGPAGSGGAPRGRGCRRGCRRRAAPPSSTGTIRSISGPGRWTRTDLSLPISEVTRRLMQAPERSAEFYQDGPARRPSAGRPRSRTGAQPDCGRRDALIRAARQEGGSGGSDRNFDSSFVARPSRRSSPAASAKRSSAFAVSLVLLLRVAPGAPRASRAVRRRDPRAARARPGSGGSPARSPAARAAQPQRHRREVRVEQPRRDGNDAPLDGVVGQRRAPPRRRRSRVDRLGRHVHEREVAGPAGGPDVLARRSRRRACARRAPNCWRARLLSRLVRRPRATRRKFSSGNLLSIGTIRSSHEDRPRRRSRRRRSGTASPGAGRQHLRQRLLEEHLAERPAQLRGLQQVLEPRDVPGELLDLLRGLVEPAHLLADVLQQVAGLAQVLRQALLPRRQALLDARDAVLDAPAQLLEAPVHGLRPPPASLPSRRGAAVEPGRADCPGAGQEEATATAPQREDRERPGRRARSGGHRLQDSRRTGQMMSERSALASVRKWTPDGPEATAQEATPAEDREVDYLMCPQCGTPCYVFEMDGDRDPRGAVPGLRQRRDRALQHRERTPALKTSERATSTL